MFEKINANKGTAGSGQGVVIVEEVDGSSAVPAVPQSTLDAQTQTQSSKKQRTNNKKLFEKINANKGTTSSGQGVVIEEIEISGRDEKLSKKPNNIIDGKKKGDSNCVLQ